MNIGEKVFESTMEDLGLSYEAPKIDRLRHKGEERPVFGDYGDLRSRKSSVR